MKKKYMAPTMKMHKTVSTSLICESITSRGGTSGLGNGTIKAGSRRLDLEDEIFDDFEHGSIWDF